MTWQKIIVTCPPKYLEILRHPLVEYIYCVDGMSKPNAVWNFRNNIDKMSFIHIKDMDTLKSNIKETHIFGAIKTKYVFAPKFVSKNKVEIEHLLQNTYFVSKTLMLDLYRSYKNLSLEIFCQKGPMEHFFSLEHYAIEQTQEIWHSYVKEACKESFYFNWAAYYDKFPVLARRDFKQNFMYWLNRLPSVNSSLMPLLTTISNKQIPDMYFILRKLEKPGSDVTVQEWIQHLTGRNLEVAMECQCVENILGNCVSLGRHQWLKHIHNMKKKKEPLYEEDLIL